LLARRHTCVRRSIVSRTSSLLPGFLSLWINIDDPADRLDAIQDLLDEMQGDFRLENTEPVGADGHREVLNWNAIPVGAVLARDKAGRGSL
jgi:hypothetical protein